MSVPLHPKRPEVVKSAVALKSRYTVQHRSDLLMKEHVQNVRSSQEELKAAVVNIKNASSEVEARQWTAVAMELKCKVDQLVLVLQVMEKLNTELSYAREDLNDALYKGIGEINAARKRVIWLEDKMGNLCGKKRLKSRPMDTLNRDYDSASDVEYHRPLNSGDRFATGEHERTRSLAQLLGSDFGPTSTDSETNQSYALQPGSGSRGHRIQDYSSDDCGRLTVHSVEGAVEPLEASRQQLRSHHKYRNSAETSPCQDAVEDKLREHRHLYASMTTLTSGQEDIAEESSGDFSPLKEVSIPDTTEEAGKEEEDDDGGVRNMTVDDEDSQPIQYFWKQDMHQDKCDEKSEQSSRQSLGEHHEIELYSEPEIQETPKTPPTHSRGEDDLQNEIDLEGSSENEKTFITELYTGLTDGSLLNLKPQVTIDSPETEAEPQDLGSSYWQSEHHRFEYSNYCGAFGEVDPLSYHTMGLAVPGSFLRKGETDFSELPWKTRLTAKDIKDIHREALDRLAQKVHSMQDKIYDAAMLSIHRKPLPPVGATEASVLHSVDRSTSDLVSVRHPRMPAKSKSMPVESMQHTNTEGNLAERKLERQSTSTSTPACLVFHPKPIPPPQVLPITRTNHKKEFPQFASSFAEPAPDQRAPAERLVDQRNLIEETKLVLYRQKARPLSPGPSSMEKRFHKMIEQDISQGHRASQKKVHSQFKLAAALTSLQVTVGTWKQIKPRSRGSEYQGLRWERVKTIVHRNLTSDKAEERIDAAKQLGLLRCGDTMVFYALKERIHKDFDLRVRYEATKALILIGCWEDEVLRMVLKYLVVGNTEIRIDLISTLVHGKNVMYVDKTVPTFLELVKVLSHFCRNPDPEDQIAFDSAVLLGCLCVRDASAEMRLMKALEEPSDSHVKAKALEILVKQLRRIDGIIVEQILNLLKTSPVWKYRVLATKLMISLGPTQEQVLENQEQLYLLLTRRLWDDPSSEVRLSAAKALAALGMFARACEAVENRLEDPDEKIRAESVISVGTLGMKNERVIRLLLEMLELDSSEYVRLMIIRSFAALKLTDRRVLRTLREREKLDGPLARESGKALRTLHNVLQTTTSRGLFSSHEQTLGSVHA